MSGGGIEKVTLWRCPNCGDLAKPKTAPTCLHTPHIEHEEATFVRADQIVERLEAKASAYREQQAQYADQNEIEMADSCEAVAIEMERFAAELKGEKA